MTEPTNNPGAIPATALLKLLMANLDLKAMAAKHFQQCRMEGCQKLSLGFLCKSCSKFCCQEHIYLSATVPPQPICQDCIGDARDERLANARPARSSKSRRK